MLEPRQHPAIFGGTPVILNFGSHDFINRESLYQIGDDIGIPLCCSPRGEMLFQQGDCPQADGQPQFPKGQPVFLLFFLIAWAGGLWIRPFGPTVLGFYWLPGLLLVTLLLLLLISLATDTTPPRKKCRAEITAERAAITAAGVLPEPGPFQVGGVGRWESGSEPDYCSRSWSSLIEKTCFPRRA